jgi:transposase
MTTLIHDPPYIFSITEGPSNGEHFSKFIQDHINIIQQHQFLIGDNASFHCKGKHFEDVQFLLQLVGTEYHLLPTYSPEFNPAELCFSVFKNALHLTHQVQGNLLIAIMDAMNHITLEKVHKFYYYCQVKKTAHIQ